MRGRKRKAKVYKRNEASVTWGGPLKIVTVNLPVFDLKFIERFVLNGDTVLVSSRSEYIRVAVRNQIIKDLELVEKQLSFLENKDLYDTSKFVRVPGYNGNEPVKILRRLE